MPEKRDDDNRWKVRAELRGHFGSGPQAGPLHDLVNDDPRHSLRRVAATDQCETVKSSDLLGHGVLHPEALEASAERLKRWYGTRQTPPPGLRREFLAVCERCPRDRGHQCVVVECARRQTRTLGLGWSRAIRAEPGSIKKIRLSVWHDILAPATLADANGPPRSGPKPGQASGQRNNALYARQGYRPACHRDPRDTVRLVRVAWPGSARKPSAASLVQGLVAGLSVSALPM